MLIKFPRCDGVFAPITRLPVQASEVSHKGHVILIVRSRDIIVSKIEHALRSYSCEIGISVETHNLQAVRYIPRSRVLLGVYILMKDVYMYRSLTPLPGDANHSVRGNNKTLFYGTLL